MIVSIDITIPDDKVQAYKAAILRVNPIAENEDGTMPTENQWLLKLAKQLAKDAIKSRYCKGVEMLHRDQIDDANEVIT